MALSTVEMAAYWKKYIAMDEKRLFGNTNTSSRDTVHNELFPAWDFFGFLRRVYGFTCTAS